MSEPNCCISKSLHRMHASDMTQYAFRSARLFKKKRHVDQSIELFPTCNPHEVGIGHSVSRRRSRSLRSPTRTRPPFPLA